MTETSVDDFSVDELLQLNQRKISLEDLKKYEGYMAEIFNALGMDIDTPSTHETPRRFIEAPSAQPSTAISSASLKR